MSGVCCAAAVKNHGSIAPRFVTHLPARPCLVLDSSWPAIAYNVALHTVTRMVYSSSVQPLVLLYACCRPQASRVLTGTGTVALQILAKAGPVGTTLLADAKDAAWLAHDAYMVRLTCLQGGGTSHRACAQRQ